MGGGAVERVIVQCWGCCPTRLGLSHPSETSVDHKRLACVVAYDSQ